MPSYQTPIRPVASCVSTFDTGAARRGRRRRRGHMTDAFVETSMLAGSVGGGPSPLGCSLPGFVPLFWAQLLAIWRLGKIKTKGKYRNRGKDEGRKEGWKALGFWKWLQWHECVTDKGGGEDLDESSSSEKGKLLVVRRAAAAAAAAARPSSPSSLL